MGTRNVWWYMKKTSSEKSGNGEIDTLVAEIEIPASLVNHDLETILLTLRHQCDSAEAALYDAVSDQMPAPLPKPAGNVPRSRTHVLAGIVSEMEAMGYEIREDVPVGELWRAVYSKGDEDKDPIVGDSFCQVSAHTTAFIFARQRAQRLVTIAT